jgi:hypothetical protein
MFSGIIESVMPILSSEELPNAYRVKIKNRVNLMISNLVIVLLAMGFV